MCDTGQGILTYASAGQELKSDSRLVREVGLTEGHNIHAIITPNANSYTDPSTEHTAAEQAASPAHLLAQYVRICAGHISALVKASLSLISSSFDQYCPWALYGTTF